MTRLKVTPHHAGVPDVWEPLSPHTSNVPPAAVGPSPSQTVGPYFHQGLRRRSVAHEHDHILVPDGSAARGERITLRGRVLDADGEVVPDALVEIWQADAAGRYAGESGADPHFFGFGRSDTAGADGEFAFRTLRPGRVVRSGQVEFAPHVQVWLGMRGLLTHLVTRVYFEDEDNTLDPVLALVPEARRGTLIAAREVTPTGLVFRFDVRLRGPHETVFFST